MVFHLGCQNVCGSELEEEGTSVRLTVGTEAATYADKLAKG